MINFPTFSDQWIKNDIKTYENNTKIASEEQDGCTNGFFYQNICISKEITIHSWRRKRNYVGHFTIYCKIFLKPFRHLF